MGRLTRDGTAEPETKFSGANGDREIFVFLVQLTTRRSSNLTRLIHTLLLLYVMTIHTYNSIVGMEKKHFNDPLSMARLNLERNLQSRGSYGTTVYNTPWAPCMTTPVVPPFCTFFLADYGVFTQNWCWNFRKRLKKNVTVPLGDPQCIVQPRHIL